MTESLAQVLSSPDLDQRQNTRKIGRNRQTKPNNIWLKNGTESDESKSDLCGMAEWLGANCTTLNLMVGVKKCGDKRRPCSCF